MVTSLSELRNNKSAFDAKLIKEVEKISNPDNREDDRFWQPEVDKAGNGYAVIRFLPQPKGEEMPWVRLWNHSFKGPTGRWYIENSLTTLGKPDPVSELNSELWNTGLESDKDIAREQKRRLVYISNILVVEDPAHPENNGQVKLFRYGKKIFDKIKDVMQPQFPGEVPLNPYDFDKGANFKFKIRTVDRFRNYDKSEFDAPSPLATNDAELEAIWNKQHSLNQFLDAKHFKSYDQLKAHLQVVIAGTRQGQMMTAEKTTLAATPVAEAPQLDSPELPPSTSSYPSMEEDSTADYFASLANDE